MEQMQTVKVSYLHAEYRLRVSNTTTFGDLSRQLSTEQDHRFPNPQNNPICFSLLRTTTTENEQLGNAAGELFDGAANVMKTLPRITIGDVLHPIRAHVIRLDPSHTLAQSADALRLAERNESSVAHLAERIAHLSTQLNVLGKVVAQIKGVQVHQPKQMWRLRYGAGGRHRHVIVLPQTADELTRYESQCRVNLRLAKCGSSGSRDRGRVVAKGDQKQHVAILESELERVSTLKQYWNDAVSSNLSPSMLFCSFEEMVYHVSSTSKHGGGVASSSSSSSSTTAAHEKDEALTKNDDNDNFEEDSDDNGRWCVVDAVGDPVFRRVALVRSSEDFFWAPLPSPDDSVKTKASNSKQDGKRKHTTKGDGTKNTTKDGQKKSKRHTPTSNDASSDDDNDDADDKKTTMDDIEDDVAPPNWSWRLWYAATATASWVWRVASLARRGQHARALYDITNRPYHIIPITKSTSRNEQHDEGDGRDEDSFDASDDEDESDDTMRVSIAGKIVDVEYAEAWCVPIIMRRCNSTSYDEDGDDRDIADVMLPSPSGPPLVAYQRHLALGGLTIRGRDRHGHRVKIYLPLLEMVDDGEIHRGFRAERPTQYAFPLSRFSQAYAPYK